MTNTNEQQIFLALGDPTRRELLQSLAQEGGQTATELAANRPISRQGISKHLGILAEAGLVNVTKEGRDRRYHFVPGPLNITVDWVSAITRQWDQRLNALGRFLDETADTVD